jgi:hypothetical protein
MDNVDVPLSCILTHTHFLCSFINNDFPLAHYICVKPIISLAEGGVDVDVVDLNFAWPVQMFKQFSRLRIGTIQYRTFTLHCHRSSTVLYLAQ